MKNKSTLVFSVLTLLTGATLIWNQFHATKLEDEWVRCINIQQDQILALEQRAQTLAQRAQELEKAIKVWVAFGEEVFKRQGIPSPLNDY